jgi:hemerythrin
MKKIVVFWMISYSLYTFLPEYKEIFQFFYVLISVHYFDKLAYSFLEVLNNHQRSHDSILKKVKELEDFIDRSFYKLNSKL